MDRWWIHKFVAQIFGPSKKSTSTKVMEAGLYPYPTYEQMIYHHHFWVASTREGKNRKSQVECLPKLFSGNTFFQANRK